MTWKCDSCGSVVTEGGNLGLNPYARVAGGGGLQCGHCGSRDLQPYLGGRPNAGTHKSGGQKALWVLVAVVILVVLLVVASR
jgi:hypothetical protein